MNREEFIAMEAQKYEAQFGRDEALRLAARALTEELGRADPRDKIIIEELQCCPKCFSGEWLLKEANGIISCLNCRVEIIPIENGAEILRQETAQEQDILVIPSLLDLRQMKREVERAFAKAKANGGRRFRGVSTVIDLNSSHCDEFICTGHRFQAAKWRTGWLAPGGLGLNEGRWRGKRLGRCGPVIKLVKPKGGPGLNLGKRRRRINWGRV